MKNPTSIAMRRTDGGQAGFTIIELMVTIFVAALFIAGIVTLTTTYNYFMALAKQTAIADNLAYGYVQQYARPDYDSTQWFTCDSTTNLKANTSAPGKVIASGNLNADDVNLPGPVAYSVTVAAPYGCVSDDASKPVRVDALVTYGSAGRSIHHIIYAGGAK